MKVLGVLMLCMVASCVQTSESPLRVIGGSITNAPDFFVSIGTQEANGPTNEFCGGALIDRDVVLTAAHCIFDASLFGEPKLVVKHSRSPDVAIRAKAVAIHPKYSMVSKSNDVALIFLESPIDARTIAVATDAEAVPSRLVVIGRGRISSFGNLHASDLRMVELPIVSTDVCRSLPGYELVHSNICAGNLDLGGQDACQGDSGGPLYDRENMLIFGIVSWGKNCAQPQSPGVYTRVSEHAEWIMATKNSFRSVIKGIPNNLNHRIAWHCHTLSAIYEQGEASGFGHAKISQIDYYSLIQDDSASLGTPVGEKCSFSLANGETYQVSHFRREKRDEMSVLVEKQGEGEILRGRATALVRHGIWCANAEGKPDIVIKDAWGDYTVEDESGYYIAKIVSHSSFSGDMIECGDSDFSVKVGFMLHGGKRVLRELRVYNAGSESIYSLNEKSQEYTVAVELRNENSGKTATVVNASNYNIVSWQLACNFSFVLHDGSARSAVKTGGEYRVLVEYPTSILGLIPKGRGVTLPISLGAEFVRETAKCRINGKRAPLIFANM